LLASLANQALDPKQIHFGEISLSGAVRAAPHTGLRLKEAAKLGFTEAVIPASGDPSADGLGLSLRRISHLKELAEGLLPCD
jgi:DNA repair protein RadA/Sms